MLDKYENSYKYIEEFFNIYPLHQLDKEHLANIKELVDKETPMKPVKPYIDDCPNCKKFMIDTEEHIKNNIPFPNYCCHCGQKLDWKI